MNDFRSFGLNLLAAAMVVFSLVYAGVLLVTIRRKMAAEGVSVEWGVFVVLGAGLSALLYAAYQLHTMAG